MGVVKGISADKYPKQSDWVGKECLVIFGYDSAKEFKAKVIRCDEEEPGHMILHLEDGRVVLSTECQHTLPK